MITHIIAKTEGTFSMAQETILLVNFGGPRNLAEIEMFLKTLLTDEDVIRTAFPKPLQDLLFLRVAKKRAEKIAHDYSLIGGKSPIFEDTEAIGAELSALTKQEVITFHRYLPSLHEAFIDKMLRLQAERIKVLPLFPQFSYATTGSIARWFFKHLPSSVVNKMRWIFSYSTHPSYIQCMQRVIEDCLATHHLKEEETILLFSAHGLPQAFISEGDIYESECILSFQKIAQGFKRSLSKLSFQSKFGKGEWLRPYTDEVCQEVLSWNEGRKNIIIVPLSFTSDHIETLFEIEKLYLPILKKRD